MRNKDYRELQISSSQLVVIFLAIIILGIIIFLLGVSVGKKHTQIADKAQIPDKITTEMVTAQRPAPVETDKTDITDDSPSLQEKTPTPPPESKTDPVSKPEPMKPTAVQGKNLYYIQIGAYQNQEGALALAESIKQKGYPALVQAPGPNAARQLYQVRVGGYKTRDQAESEKARMIRDELTKNKDYFIVRN